MHVERLFSQVKKATPKKLPLAERVCAAGLLTQWMRPHLQAGGRDPRVTTRADLLADGVPLECEKLKSNRGGLTAAMVYSNEMKVERKADKTKPAMTQNESNELVRNDIRVSFPALPAERRQHYKDLANKLRKDRIDTPPDAAATYDGTRRFGLCDSRNILFPDRVEQVFSKAAKHGSRGGLSHPAQVLRSELSDSCVICDQGDPLWLREAYAYQHHNC
jgi:hypothetical protein